MLTCPECDSTNIVHDVATWASQSLEPSDLGNTATLVEYQCADCSRSFWLGEDFFTSRDDVLFRKLDAEEEAAFRAWTRSFWSPKRPDGFDVYHPVVRDEWAKIDAEVYAPVIPDEIVEITASEIMFAGTEADWPKGGGWYVFPQGKAHNAVGPFASREAAQAGVNP